MLTTVIITTSENRWQAMPPIYSVAVRNARLTQVQKAIDEASPTAGTLQLLSASNTVLASFTLNLPSASVAAGVLSFLGLPIFTTAVAIGTAALGQILDGNGVLIVSGLVVGVDIGIAGSPVVAIGETLELFSAQITGN